MSKTYLVIPVLLTTLFVLNTSARAATHYVDCSVASSGDGTSWGTAWKALSNITGVSSGDIVFISGSSSCATYTTTQWTPINGSVGNPIIYRVGQDAGHTSPVTITLTGSPGLTGTSNLLQGIYIDGNFGGSSNMSINGLLGAAGVIAWNGVRLSYLKMNNTVIEGTTFQGLQLDHNSVNLPCGDDHFFTSGASAGNIGYTNNSIHDNIVELCQVNDGSGHGSDGFQWIENVSYYNNVLFWQFTATANGQHADGIQTSGSYVAIYDNYFENAGNYDVYGDFFGSAAHWRIYNNVFTAFSGHGTGISGQKMGLGFEVGGQTLDDFTVSNNTCYDAQPNHACVDFGGGSAGSETNSFIVNNIANTDGIVIFNGNSVINSNNTTSGTEAYANAAPYPSGNWNEAASSTNSIGKGIDPSYLTSIYTTDKAGNPRGSTWDIGAYELNSGTASAPAAPSNLSLALK
jgi:hypothetical protein